MAERLGNGGFTLDVVGIGALNLDYLATASPLKGQSGSRRLTGRIAQLLGTSIDQLEWGVEHSADEATIRKAMEHVSSAQLRTILGGSAFNAIRAIALTQVGLRLGYVGVAGRVPVFGMSCVEELDRLGVDRRFVFEDQQQLCGICFSFAEDGERTLLTHAGANDAMPDHLDLKFHDLAHYLAGARVIHVTSFLDDRTAGKLHALLSQVKKLNSGTLICFDPGHVWSVERTPDIDALVGLSDYLLVNSREFHELGGEASDESNEDVAERLLTKIGNERGVVVVKRSAGILSYRREGDEVHSEFYPQIPLAEEEIEDATGAGDVFAAGLLTVLTYDRLQVELGSLLGMRLARHKLRYVGTAGHAQFAEVTKSFIATLDAERRSGGKPTGVFIAHGANPEWLAVQQFVLERFKLPVYSFESGSWGGRQVTEALADYLERCSFAICVLTAEDFTGDGLVQARQNVIHEVGLFQGRHGFDRVMVLVEEGCDFVPPTAAPYTIPFSHNGISGTFFELGKMLSARGLGPTESPAGNWAAG